MAYSMDELLIRNNRGGNLATCWLAATKKNFIGSGSSHLTKREVLDVNINSACGDISKGLNSKEGNPRSNFYTSSQLVFGAIKVFQTQLEDLEDEVKKLYSEVLAPKTENKKKKERTTKKSKDVNLSEDNLLEQELPIIDLENYFPQGIVDKNLIEEDITFAPTQAYVPTGFGDTDEELDDNMFDRMAEDLAAGDSGIPNLPESTFETPSKRKSRKAHDETPTKRKKTSTLSKSLRGETPSPQARRPLFGTSDIPQSSISTAIQQNEATATLADMNGTIMNAGVSESIEQMPAQCQPSLTDGELQNNQHNEDQLPVSSDPYQLPDLDEISLNSTSNQKKKKQKKIIVFDKCTQIKITEPPTVEEHTMIFRPIEVPGRVPANFLLHMPSTVLGRGLRSYNNNVCSWNRSLQTLYTEMIKAPCTDVSRFTSTITSRPRDYYVNKDFRGRLSKDNFMSKSSDLLQEKSSRQLDSRTDLLERDSNSILPPPASVADLHEEFASPQMRHPKDRGIPELIPCDSATAASPRQERLSQSMMKEASVAPDSVVETEVQDNESPMTEKEFFKFLKRASQEFGNNKILLDDIFQPNTISEYENKGKLQIEQDAEYGPIYITIEEE